MQKQISFEYMNYWNVNIQLRDRITELSGDTATGKTFIYSIIEDYVKENRIEDIKCLDKDFCSKLGEKAVLDLLKTYKNSVVIIDQANAVLRNDAIEDYVSYDFDSNNYYLLIGRSLPITSRYTELARADIDGKNVRIKYVITPAMMGDKL